MSRARAVQIAIALAAAAWWIGAEVAPQARTAPRVLIPCGDVDWIEVVEGARRVRGDARWLEVTVTTAGGGPIDTTVVRGDERARAALDALAGAISLADLGELGEADLRAAGLDDPGRLEVRCGEATHTLELGTAFGPGRRRARAADGSVHAIDGRAIADLLTAEVRLQDRDVLGVDPARADLIELRADEGSRTLRRAWGDPGLAFAAEDGGDAARATAIAARVARLAAHGWMRASDPLPEGSRRRLAIAIADRTGARVEITIACTDPPRARCWAEGGGAAPDRAFVVPSAVTAIARDVRDLPAPTGPEPAP